MADYGGEYVLERVIYEQNEIDGWTVPRWAKHGDVVFFMHASSVKSYLRSIRKTLTEQKNSYSRKEFNKAMRFIQHGLDLYNKYGGKIFAIAHVTGLPELLNSEEEGELYWHSKIYAKISKAYFLEHPVDISEFRHFISIAKRTSITPVVGNNFDKLKELHGNDIPRYVAEAKAVPLPLTDINMDLNLRRSSENFTLITS